MKRFWFSTGVLAALLALSAAFAQPSLAAPADKRVLIRNGFVVPANKVLEVDDISIVCNVLSEVTTSDDDFHKFGVEATAVLRITYPVSACPEPLDSEHECPVQDYVIGTAAAHGLQASFVATDQFGQKRSDLAVGAGRVMMNVFASEGATLLGICEGGSETNFQSGEGISVGTGTLLNR
jgi:hypothetical protein